MFIRKHLEFVAFFVYKTFYSYEIGFGT